MTGVVGAETGPLLQARQVIDKPGRSKKGRCEARRFASSLDGKVERERERAEDDGDVPAGGRLRVGRYYLRYYLRYMTVQRGGAWQAVLRYSYLCTCRRR